MSPTATANVSIRVQRSWGELLALDAPRVLALHAPVRCGQLEAALALAVRSAAVGDAAGLWCPSLDEARDVLAGWGLAMRRMASREAAWVELPGAAQLTVLAHGQAWPSIGGPAVAVALAPPDGWRPPRAASKLAVIAPMPDVGSALATELLGGSYEVVGLTAARLLEDGACCEEDIAATGLQPGSAAWRRSMDLDASADPRVAGESFTLFARRRLRIRTDKPLHLLSPTQREEASGQYGVPVVTFEVSALQRRYLAAKRLAQQRGKRPWFILLKYRRGGFTTLEQGLSYRCAVARPRSFVVTLAHTKASTQRIFRMVSLMHEKDPSAPKRMNVSTTSLELENGSYFFIDTAGGKSFARGDTLQRVHGSEVAKWCEGPRQQELVDDLFAGIVGAASNGEVVLESTPNGREWFYQAYQDAKIGANELTPIFLRWFDDPMNAAQPGTFSEEEVLDTLTEQEKSLAAQHQLSLAQLAFRRQAKRTYKRLFAQEMPEDDASCFISSGVCFFDVERVIELLEETANQQEDRKHLPGGYEVEWEPPQEGRDYVLGADTSEGLPGCDNSGIGVLDRETGDQVAAVHGLFSPRLLADHIARYHQRYNGALIAVERANHGHAVLQRLKEIGLGRQHDRGGPMLWTGRGAPRAGWDTNGETRPIMLDELAEAVEEGHMRCRDRTFLDECLSFKLQHGGKFEADPGAKDDAVLKWAIAWQARKVRRTTTTTEEL